LDESLGQLSKKISEFFYTAYTDIAADATMASPLRFLMQERKNDHMLAIDRDAEVC
jgi:hypothetical protein